MTLLVVPPGQPTVERHGPLFPALETNITLCFCTASVITSQILLKDKLTWIRDSVQHKTNHSQPPVQYLPCIGPVGGFPIAIVNQVTLVVDDFNHLWETRERKEWRVVKKKKRKKKVGKLQIYICLNVPRGWVLCLFPWCWGGCLQSSEPGFGHRGQHHYAQVPLGSNLLRCLPRVSHEPL